MSRPAVRPSHGSSLRPWLLLALVLLWFWAGSAFTPWALSAAPMMVFYDTLFYARFALGAWWLAEIGLMIARRQSPAMVWTPLALALALALLIQALRETGPGLKLLVRASLPALERSVEHRAGLGEGSIPADDDRRRIGAFLIDSWRLPCDAGQAWLWLGRPFGAGSGINLALVRSPVSPPATPDPAAFRFHRLTDGWWLAYQNPRAYYRADGPLSRGQAVCTIGLAVPSHKEGRAFIHARFH